MDQARLIDYPGFEPDRLVRSLPKMTLRRVRIVYIIKDSILRTNECTNMMVFTKTYQIGGIESEVHKMRMHSDTLNSESPVSEMCPELAAGQHIFHFRVPQLTIKQRMRASEIRIKIKIVINYFKVDSSYSESESCIFRCFLSSGVPFLLFRRTRSPRSSILI